MGSEQLNDRLESIPGVASAEVTLSDEGPPRARIWLDGSRDPDEVRRRVEALLGSTIPSVPPTPGERPKRRSGLGRGLGDVMEAHDAESEPTHLREPTTVLQPVPPRSEQDIRRVGVVETPDGVHIEVEDAIGNRRVQTVGADGSIDAAVIEAIRSLFLVSPSVRVDLTDAESDHGSIVVATVIGDEGIPQAGAAYVDFGRPWAVARAVTQALA